MTPEEKIESKLNEIESKLNDDERAAHLTIRELLWVLYPTPETTQEGLPRDPAKASALDKMSHMCAMYIVDGLKMRGFSFVREEL